MRHVRQDNPIAALDAGLAAAERAARHAGVEWRNRAVECIAQYAQSHDEFLSQDVVAWATDAQLIGEPPDRRAWGAAFSAARKSAIVTSAGFARDGWGSIKSKWRSLKRMAGAASS